MNGTTLMIALAIAVSVWVGGESVKGLRWVKHHVQHAVHHVLHPHEKAVPK